MTIRRLNNDHEAALEELLQEDPVQNLFLIGFLDANGLGRGHWYGSFAGRGLRAIVLVLPGRLLVPWARDPADAADLGTSLVGKHPPSMVVGPREACDAFWRCWAPKVAPDRHYDQRLYVCRAAAPGTAVGFRRATLQDAPIVAQNAGRMEEEDLGRNPARTMPEMHAQVVRDRIRNGKTWVLERDGDIVFQINVGTAIPLGCQVGGTYVPPEHRGRGYGALGMQELCRQLLPRHAGVTLHVNEANRPAVRVYEEAGFERHAPFRLITVRG